MISKERSDFMKRLVCGACILLIAVSITFSTVITASAHPGRTDSNGGHTDHSTGEYHYHHGYEAHSHYDMDGDGDIDCPYDFDDKTNHNKSDSNSSGESAYDRRLRELMEKYGTPTEPPITTVPEHTIDQKSTIDKFTVAFAVCIFMFGVWMIFVYNRLNELAKYTPTIPNKLHIIVCIAIFAVAFILLTSSIEPAPIYFRDMSGESFSVAAIIGYAFVYFALFVFTVSIQLTLLMIPFFIYLFSKYPDTTARDPVPKHLAVDIEPTFYCVGSILIYHFILYAFGQIDFLMPLFFQ
jgi:hypothetical protein